MSEGKSGSEQRTDLADERTDLAEDRTLLANERTFAGWARTSFASLGLGLGFQALFQKVEPTWVPKSVATIFIIISIAIIWTAFIRASKVIQAHSANEVEAASDQTYRRLAIGVTIGALGLATAMWFLL